MSRTNRRIIFYGIWLTALLLQAYFTELTPDEAYYWMYSRELAWGYFDHPPVIAVLIKIGYAILPDVLGVRLIPIILSTLMIYFLEQIIRPQQPVYYYLLVISVGILHFVGFFATPDIPILFFATLCLLLYQRFLENPGWQNAIGLGLAAGLMCISKYHGFIIIGLVVLSNLKLLLNKYFWLMALTAVIVLLPHIIWQINAGFPSFSYHLVDRSTAPYQFSFTTEYLSTQLFVLGPFVGFLFFIAAYQVKTRDAFERCLKFLFWGGYIFFLLMTFKGRVEAHWTLFILLPALYFGVKWIETSQKARRFLYYQLPIVLLLLIGAKFLTIADLDYSGNRALSKSMERYHNKDFMRQVEALANDRNVVFINSYQLASVYSFYAEGEGISIRNTYGRRNQFDIWETENRHRGEQIIYLTNDPESALPLVPEQNDYHYGFVDDFQRFSDHQLAVVLEEISPDTIRANVRIHEGKATIVNQKDEDYGDTNLLYYIYKDNELLKEVVVQPLASVAMREKIQVEIPIPKEEGELAVQFGLQSGPFPPTFNSERISISNTAQD
jgi:hypothetical protein